MLRRIKQLFLKKKLHILFLCSWYPSRVLPTNGDFIQRHAEAVATTHKVTLLHLITDPNISSIEKETTTTQNVTIHIIYIPLSSNILTKFFLFIKLYISEIKKIQKIDIVHLNVTYPVGIIAIYCKWMLKIPYIISEHWTGYLTLQSKKIGFTQKLISKIITKNASYICPISNYLEISMQNFGLKGNYKPIPNVIDTTLFTPTTQKENYFTIVHVSSLLDTHKNISGMLRAAKFLEETIPNFTWKFIGGSSENYKKLLDSLEFKTAKIQFINHLSHKEIVAHIQRANIVVSFSNYETFGIVLLEAIACGVSVISTNTGIANELETSNYCTVLPNNNPLTLCNAIVVSKNDKKPSSLKMHNFVKDNFSKIVIEKKFTELYNKTLNY